MKEAPDGDGDLDGSRPGRRSWRTSGAVWSWGDGRDDYGSVFGSAGRYVASTARGSATFEALADAKDFVEEHAS